MVGLHYTREGRVEDELKNKEKANEREKKLDILSPEEKGM